MGLQMPSSADILALAKERIAIKRGPSPAVIKTYTADELADWIPEDDYFRFDEPSQSYLVYWGGYEYAVDLDRITSPLALLGWVAHLGEKKWELSSSSQIARFVTSVCNRRGWDLWGAV